MLGSVQSIRISCATSLKTKAFVMLRRLFDAVVLPTVSYGCEVWAPLCAQAPKSDVKSMTDIQIAFVRKICQLRKGVSPSLIFREFAERPWDHTWWVQVLGFMRRLACLPQCHLHSEILRDNIANAGLRSPYSPHLSWAKGVETSRGKFPALAWSLHSMPVELTFWIISLFI